MAYKRNYLVVANVTAASPELQDALARRADASPASFKLILPAAPATGGRSAAAERLRVAVEALRERGLEAEGELGDCDPYVAVAEAWDPRRYDEIIVSTLPMRFSKWLHAGLPERIGRLTGAPVFHVVSKPRNREHHVTHLPDAAERRPVFDPLSVFAWGAHED